MAASAGKLNRGSRADRVRYRAVQFDCNGSSEMDPDFWTGR